MYIKQRFVCRSCMFPYVLSHISEIGNQRYARLSLEFKVRKGPSGLKSRTRKFVHHWLPCCQPLPMRFMGG